MPVRPVLAAILLAGAGVSFWLLLAEPRHLFGIDAGQLGAALLVTVLWTSLWFLSCHPIDRMDTAASHGEWQAWIGSAFLALVIVYFLSQWSVFAVPGTVLDNPAAARVGRNGVMLLVAWVVLSSVLGRRWKLQVTTDERDRLIASRAGHSARNAQVILIVGLAVTLGFSGETHMRWATPLLLAHLLILVLMIASLVESLASAFAYWRDRH